jgi:putative flavoprotein involved in K+ transport
MTRTYDVVVVGGGQAGLAMGYHLARRGRDFVILDAAPRVGHAWRTRWDSLTLFTPARYSALPGLAFPADPDHLPRKEEVADYLDAYARGFGLPVRAGEPVLAVRPLVEDAGFEVETLAARYHARQVVIATGAFQRPVVPALADALPPDVVQLHSSDYRGPAQLPSRGELLVVGGGNSGVQIAAELAGVARTHLAVGEVMMRLPESFLGRSIFWWLEKAGVMDIPVESRMGRRMRGRDALIGRSPAMLSRQLGVEILGRAVSASGNRVVTQGGQSVEVAGVVWATGYRPDYDFLEAPVLDARGRPVHAGGVTSVPGLYFLGLPWQSTRGSALLGWVGRDAARLAERIFDAAGDVRSSIHAPSRPRPAPSGRG